MSRFSKKVVCFKDFEGVLARRTSTDDVYYCPYCYTREKENGVKDPKPDRHGKLFINRQTSKGICFRCSTVIVPRKDEGKLALNFENEDETISPDSLPDVDLAGLPMAHTNEITMSYLRGRNKAFTPSVVKKLDFRWIETGKMVNDIIDGPKHIKITGVLAPLKYKGTVKSYQIRYITTNKRFRFHTMEGKKLLYSAKSTPVFSEITLCEGVYDAIACMAMGFPNVSALLGKTPSNIQIAQLKELAPYKINLCLDEPDLNYALLRVLRREVKTLESYKAWKFKGFKDPEEFYKANQNFRFDASNSKKIGLIL